MAQTAQSSPVIATLTIAAGQTTSDHVPIRGFEKIAVYVPAINPSGTVEIQVSFDGDTWHSVASGTGVDSVLKWPASSIETPRAFSTEELRALSGYRYFRVVTGAAQSAARTITVEFKYC